MGGASHPDSGEPGSYPDGGPCGYGCSRLIGSSSRCGLRRVVCDRRRSDHSKRPGSARGSGILGRVEGVAAPALRPVSAARRGVRAAGWIGEERRDLQSETIEPVSWLGRLLRGFSPRDLARDVGKSNADFGLRSRIRLRALNASRNANGLLCVQALRGSHRLDVRILDVGLLGHYPRRFARPGGLHALLLNDGPRGSDKMRSDQPGDANQPSRQGRARTILQARSVR